MAHRHEHDDEWDEDFDDDFDDDSSDWSDDEAATIACPCCRADIHEDAQRCPECWQYLSAEDSRERKPWWIIAGAIVCLYVAFRWIVG
ncbi:MAG TPA: hypothetical protein VG713_00140 [Pirellulales bacterium]|nr:hypothetical protein [Pirellulales bacterium]